MKTRYDPETDALYVCFAEVPILETEEVCPGVMLDFDAEGRIAAIEVLDASERLSTPTPPIDRAPPDYASYPITLQSDAAGGLETKMQARS